MSPLKPRSNDPTKFLREFSHRRMLILGSQTIVWTWFCALSSPGDEPPSKPEQGRRFYPAGRARFPSSCAPRTEPEAAVSSDRTEEASATAIHVLERNISPDARDAKRKFTAHSRDLRRRENGRSDHIAIRRHAAKISLSTKLGNRWHPLTAKRLQLLPTCVLRAIAIPPRTGQVFRQQASLRERPPPARSLVHLTRAGARCLARTAKHRY